MINTILSPSGVRLSPIVKKKKKKCLIGLYGLSRTFKETSKLLFERVIEPNNDKYDFDIIINTDFNNLGMTCNRFDTISGISTHKYNDVECLKNDLKKTYNKYNQLKDIIIYNYNNNLPILSWCLVYKRIQEILLKAFKINNVYDKYIMYRIDTVLDKKLYLDDINNEILLITANFTRNAFLHNRDVMDLVMCGTYKPFMYWVINIINLFDSLISKNADFKSFYSKEYFCSNNLIEMLNADISKLQDNNTFENINELVKLRNTPIDVVDFYHQSNKKISRNFCEIWEISKEELFERLLNAIRLIFIGNSSFILSENKENAIHAIIVR
jgi:hypothetical protein